MTKTKISSLASILAAVLVSTPLLTQAGFQSQDNNYGVSGGNVNDITNAFCCSGTLGSLVKDSSNNLYILSNNHVLARQDQASVGEDISQPGLIDNSCRPPRIVADLTNWVPLGNNVDCAIAALRPNTMNTTGSILGIGIPSSTIVNPSVNLAVVKSGRTTGTTHGRIGSINTSVTVQYQIRCGSGKKYKINYTNQVLINSSSFSAGGDSGSLIVTDNTTHNPVALLFAGSSTTTIANPIGEVLSKLGTRLGRSIGVTSAQTPVHSGGSRVFDLPEQAVEHASIVLEQNRHDLMSRPAVLGVGLGALEDNSAPAMVVYVDQTSAAKPQLPAQADNTPIRVVMTDPFVAF